MLTRQGSKRRNSKTNYERRSVYIMSAHEEKRQKETATIFDICFLSPPCKVIIDLSFVYRYGK